MTKAKTSVNPKCIATNKAGHRCGKWAMNGTTVCRNHGGAAPQTRERARQRILEAADPAVTTVLEIMFSRKSPAAVRLAAARDLLDRAGLSPRSIVEVDVGVDSELLSMIGEARENARAEIARRELPGRSTDDADVIDAELLPDEGEPVALMDADLVPDPFEMAD